MKRYIYAAAALVAAISSCSENTPAPIIEEPNRQEITFTATMETTPATKATFDDDARRASWEVDDQICINGQLFQANAAGTRTTFTQMADMRPTYIGSASSGFDGEGPEMLVDAGGTNTKWCTDVNKKNWEGTWDIVVKTEMPSKLKAIKLWNGNDTEDNPGRRWKDVKVSGRTAQDAVWTELKTFTGLNLDVNNGGLAGTLNVDATNEYEYYKVEVLDVVDGDIMQMSDMRFVGETQDIHAPYNAFFPATLYDGTTEALPATVIEEWADGKFNMPMYATSSDKYLSFKNLCGVLKITVKSDEVERVARIRVSSANKAVSGAFNIEGYTAVLTNALAADNTLTITYKDAVPTDEEGTVFYVALPAQSYRELKIEIDADGTGFTRSMTTKAGVDITVERNKIYSFTYADNVPNTGTAKAKIGNLEMDVNWVRLWPCGPKFAEYNVGVTNGKATSYGEYYTWGGNVDIQNTTEPSGYNTGNAVLSGKDDTATKLWGNQWRMPTADEYSALIANCDVEWTTQDGVNGCRFTGKSGAYRNNSVFFPASGFYYANDGKGELQQKGEVGYYWTSTPGDDNDDAQYMIFVDDSDPNVFDDSDPNVFDNGTRFFGLPVRAVLAE